MDKEIIKQIILASIPLIGTLISLYIMPIIKDFLISRVDREDVETFKVIFTSLTDFIDKMVKAMEQEHPDWIGETKKEEVLNLTIKYAEEVLGLHLDFTEINFISEIIEGIVKEVKHSNDNLQFVVDSIEKNTEDDLK